MSDEQPEVAAEPKKKRGRPKGSTNKKKAQKEESLALLAKVAGQLAEVSGRLDNLEAINTPRGIVARGPNAPTTSERENMELMPQTPGPVRQEKTDAERNKERRDAIYAARQARGRIDREVMPSGVIASVGNRQRRQSGATRITNRPQ